MTAPWTKAEVTDGVLVEVVEERIRQGEHPDNWPDIFEQEAGRVSCEIDLAALRARLVRVAAVSVAWVEAIDRRT